MIKFDKLRTYRTKSGLGGAYTLKFVQYLEQNSVYEFKIVNKGHERPIYFFEDTIHNVTQDRIGMSYNKRLSTEGILIYIENGVSYLEYKGRRTVMPDVESLNKHCVDNYGVII